MSEEPAQEPPKDPGFFSRPAPEPAVTGIEIVAGALSVAWLVVLGVFYSVSGDGERGGVSILMLVLALILPVATIWTAAITLRTARGMRDEAQRLQAALDAMRNAYIIQNQGSFARPSVEYKLDQIVAAQKQTETALATFSTGRNPGATVPSADRKAALAAPKPTPEAEEQPALALGTPAEVLRDPVSISDFVRALNFPDSQEDREGFQALRRALEDREMARLIRAAQDILTLLSQDGIYMDDLKPDRARPEFWRKFAQGERGRAVAPLGGIRDRSSLALTAGRMRQDAVFRDAAHHFLRQFDKTFVEFEANASDEEVAALSETRTARAFMLLGRVTGTFD